MRSGNNLLLSFDMFAALIVIPAQAGIQSVGKKHWMPAFAGMTDGELIFILLGAFRPFRDIKNRATVPLHFVVETWL